MKNVAVSKSLEELAREVARVQCQPAGKEVDSETSNEGGPRLPLPKSAQIMSKRRHHRLCMLVDYLCDLSRWRVGRIAPGAKSCEDSCSSTELSNRSWDVEIDGALVVYSNDSFVQGVPSPWFAASCCRDGSLAVIQPLWVQKTSEVPSMFEGVATVHTCAHPTSACTSLGRHCNITHPSQSSSHGYVHPHFAGNVHVTVRASLAWRKKDTVPVLVPLTHVGRS